MLGESPVKVLICLTEGRAPADTGVVILLKLKSEPHSNQVLAGSLVVFVIRAFSLTPFLEMELAGEVITVKIGVVTELKLPVSVPKLL